MRNIIEVLCHKKRVIRELLKTSVAVQGMGRESQQLRGVSNRRTMPNCNPAKANKGR